MNKKKNNYPVDNTKELEPVCSVCIANYNGVKIIGPCIESVLSQDCEFPYEIIVHDDASTDESVAFIQKYYPEISLIVSQTNVGFCVSNNRMATRARGKFILFLNNDARLHKDALRTLYNETKKHQTPMILSLPQYDRYGKVTDIGYFLNPFMNLIPNLNFTIRKIGVVSGACLWIPKDLWNELGGFPEWFHTGHEDTFLCCYARLKGYPVVALPQSGYNHWIGYNLSGRRKETTGLVSTYFRRSHAERNKTFVMLTCYPSLALYLVFPIHILLLTIEGLLLTLVKREPKIWSEIYFFCFRSLWSERRRILQTRHKLQSQKRIGLLEFFNVFVLSPYKLKMLLKYGVPKLS